MATRSVAAPVEATPGEVAVNDANVIFTTVWDALVEELGAEPKLSIPGELIFLVGAPGAGKGTNTQFVMETRGITAPPIGVSMTGRSMWVCLWVCRCVCRCVCPCTVASYRNAVVRSADWAVHAQS